MLHMYLLFKRREGKGRKVSAIFTRFYRCLIQVIAEKEERQGSADHDGRLLPVTRFPDRLLLSDTVNFYDNPTNTGCIDEVQIVFPPCLAMLNIYTG